MARPTGCARSSSSTRTTLPLKQQVGGWKTYGGIFRDIYILAVPKFFIEDAVATSAFSSDFKSAKLNVKMDLTDRWSGLKGEPGIAIGCQFELFDKLSNEQAGKSVIVPVSPKANKTISASQFWIIKGFPVAVNENRSKRGMDPPDKITSPILRCHQKSLGGRVTSAA